jgi:hypothetical protein
MKDTLPCAGLCPQAPAQLLRERTADGKSQPEAFGLGRIERLEDSLR